MQTTKYKRITNNERQEISRSLALGMSTTEISKELGRNRVTKFREIKRNRGKSGYRAFSASRRAQDSAGSRRRGKTRLDKDKRLRTYVLQRLTQQWSPKGISERLKIEYPLNMEMRISHEAIYRYIYVLPRGELKRTLIRALRQEHAYRHNHKVGKRSETRGRIADMLSIEERPVEVEDRTVPGHWEGDLILGKNKQSALGTLVERTTRYTIRLALSSYIFLNPNQGIVKYCKAIMPSIAIYLNYFLFLILNVYFNRAHFLPPSLDALQTSMYNPFIKKLLFP
jgi:IS30 family transposase